MEFANMSLAEHPLRSAAILLWSVWLAYTCFRRGIQPPKDRISRWGYCEVEVFNRNPLVRALSILAGLLVLLIGFGLVIGK
jgi:hypothetical protein